MKPELIVIDDIKGLLALIEYVKDKTLVAYDSETTGLTVRDQIIGYSICAEPDKAYYVILSKWNPAITSLETNHDPGFQKAVIYNIKQLKDKSLIMHNGVFDCMMAEAFFKVRLTDSLHTDTMILAHLLNENRRVGLKELGASMYGETSTIEAKEMKDSVLANGGKLTKTQYEMYKADSHLMAKYGAKDALLTFKLFLDLVPELYEQKLDEFFYTEESMSMLRGPTYTLNTTGLNVDTKYLAVLKSTLQAECAAAKDFIYQEIGPLVKTKYPGTTKTNTFNIGASQQLSWLLFGAMGLEFGTLTKGGKTACKALGIRLPYTALAKREFIATCEAHKDTLYQPEAKVNGKIIKGKKVRDPWAYIAVDKQTLKKLASKRKWIERLLEYQRKMKILTTYVKGIEERVQYGVIYPSFLQHGTSSGRYSSRNPNFQNLPREDKRVKEFIVPRPGKVFVGADYSQLEPRVFAYVSKDEKLLASFNNGEDFYSVVGLEVYDKLECAPFKEGPKNAFGVMYPKLRQDAKVFALASTYGATGPQLAPLMGKSPDDAQRDIDSYFEKFPAVAKMMTDSHEQAKSLGQVTNMFGRPRRIPEAKNINKIYGNLPHAELPYDARKLLNLSVNHRIQSTAASIVNRSAISFYNSCKDAGIDCKIVVQVHDSLVIECHKKDADNVALLLQHAMENTVQLEGIRLEAVPKIGNNLAEV